MIEAEKVYFNHNQKVQYTFETGYAAQATVLVNGLT